MTDWFEKHAKTLEGATQAIRERTYWSAYPEVPSGKIYGESAKDDGLKAFQARLNNVFDLGQPAGAGTVGEEVSPFGVELNVKYPAPDVDALLKAAQAAMPKWRDAGAKARVGVCLEILARLNQRSFELANAVMHTTGQGFMMAFQAGGPHAQDRGLEAVAYAWQEMRHVPETSNWTKQVAKDQSITLKKRYTIVPRGVSLVIGCSTFPTWNSYPALFASLATGNPVIVKPHPGAALPLAITVEVAREVLRESGFDPNLVTLAADTSAAPIAKTLAQRAEVKLIDYTGGSAFGEWIEQNAPQATLFTEKAGVNSTVLDSVEDLKAVTGNLAFSLCLYSGQMCTTPQNIFIPRDGIRVGGEKVSFDAAAAAIVKAVDWFVSDPRRAAEALGALQNPHTLKRVEQAPTDGGKVVRAAAPVENEAFPNARTRTPLILQAEANDEKLYMREMFGPIAYIVRTADTAESLKLAGRAAKELGAITFGVYATDEKTLDEAERVAVDAGVPLSCNLTGPIFVNQSAAFSDYHVSGCNPSGNATLTDASFVASRFRVVQSRRPA